MELSIDRLTECISKAVQKTHFRNVFGNSFESSVMSDLYSRNDMHEHCRLTNPDAIITREKELITLVSVFMPSITQYRSSGTGAIGNGFYNLLGSSASPRLPSIEDYAKLLILAGSRIDPERVACIFMGWLDDRPIKVWQRSLLKGVITDEQLSPKDGLRVETTPTNHDEFPRSLHVQINRHDIDHEQYAQRAILSFECQIRPVLYMPDEMPENDLRSAQRPTTRNPTLSSLTLDSLCRAMSLQVNNPIEWFMGWQDYGELDAFFLNPGHSSIRRDVRDRTSVSISEEQLSKSLEVHEWLRRLTRLDLAIARWHRSKCATTKEEQLVELRIALESVLLSDDKGVVAEKRHRLAIRGAWFLGLEFEERKKYFRTLRDAYDSASKVLHAGSLTDENTETLECVIRNAQDICREAVLRIARVGRLPDWTEVVLGSGNIGREDDT